MGKIAAAPAPLTLGEAYELTKRTRWSGLRAEASITSQARKALESLARLMGVPYAFIKPAMVTTDHIAALRDQWASEGLSPGTINHRMGALSSLGVTVKGCRAKRSRKPKWWLRPEVQIQVIAYCSQRPDDEAIFMLADYTAWATLTGMRVEESLRLCRDDFMEDFTVVTVPGTKTMASQATLPLLQEATEIAKRRFTNDQKELRLFPVEYHSLKVAWQKVRLELGITDPLATLKAFRRSAARSLHVDRGLPLDMLREYLRHESINTTMGYLRLTGGYGTKEYGRYLR